MTVRLLTALLLLFAMAQTVPTRAFANEPSVLVEVEGLSGPRLQNVKAALTLPPGIVRNGRVEERWLERYLGKVPKLVAAALEPFGNYRSRVTFVTDRPDELSWKVTVRVEAGPQTTLRRVSVTLAGEGAGEEILLRDLREFPLREGAALDHQLYEKGKLDLRLHANELGYLKAAFATRVLRVYPKEDAAEIELLLDTGPRFYFGETSFVEDKGLFEEAFLQRFLTYRQGDVFSHKELHRSRLNFYGANRFEDVLMIPLIDEARGSSVPVRVTLVAGKQQRLRPGIGYGTNTGGRISLSYKNMQVGETPHALQSDLSLAQKAQFYEARYTIPQEGGSDNNLIGTLGLRQEDLHAYTTRMIYAEGEETYGLGRGKTGSLFLRYLSEDSDVGTDNNTSLLLIPGVRYYQRSYDDPLNPRSGYQFRLELRGSLNTLLTDVTIGQALAAGSFMLPLTNRLTLHSRVEAATTIKDDEFSQVPPSMRFFVGGDNSVRGYAYKSRGPRDGNGDVIGGESLLVGSLEGEYALNDQWGLALFFDAGSAFNISEEMDVIQGAGLGVRRYTQIGPIKFDLATRIKDSNHGIRIHFSIGFDI